MEAQASYKSPSGESSTEEDQTHTATATATDISAQELPLSAIERQYAAQPASLPRRIHMIGTGSIGKLVAHSLRSIPNPPPITLMFHRGMLLRSWQEGKRAITVQDGDLSTEQRGYEVELLPEIYRQHGLQVGKADGKSVYGIADELGMKPHAVAEAVRKEQERDSKSDTGYQPLEAGEATTKRKHPFDKFRSNEPIHNLIIATKTIRTIAALKGIKHRLTRESTICFLQNGMGVIDDVNEKIFPDEATRPNYIQGIISHGANVPPEKAAQDPFFVVHAGHGTIALGAIPKQTGNSRPLTPTGHGTDNDGQLQDKQATTWSPSARYLLRTLTRCPILCAVGFTPIELFQLQLEKLAVNSIINPMTCLLDNRNGSILHKFALTRTIRLMLAETSLVIRSLPELRGIPNAPNRFSAERLESLVVSVADKTRDNISSMLADMRAGRQTEIEYINGYVVKRGEEMGIKAVVNYAIMQTVVGKCQMVQQEVRESIPVAGKTEGLNRE